NKSLKIIATDAFWPDLYSPPPTVHSPAGNRIALPVWHGNNVDVILTDDDGTNLVILPTEADRIDGLTWSPDGKFVAMRASTGDEQAQNQVRLIWARADGSDQHTLLYDDVNILGWNGKTNELLYFGLSGANSSLVRLDLETNTSTVLLGDLDRGNYIFD